MSRRCDFWAFWDLMIPWSLHFTDLLHVYDSGVVYIEGMTGRWNLRRLSLFIYPFHGFERLYQLVWKEAGIGTYNRNDDISISQEYQHIYES